jgi:hypothetical protein
MIRPLINPFLPLLGSGKFASFKTQNPCAC